MIKVEIDRSICIGAAECVRLAGTHFEIDDENISTVVAPATLDLDTARLVERSCPSGAITVRDDRSA